MNGDKSGVLSALTDRGVFQPDDTGVTWDRLDIEWEVPYGLTSP
jgi:hypothetical protein